MRLVCPDCGGPRVAAPQALLEAGALWAVRSWACERCGALEEEIEPGFLSHAERREAGAWASLGWGKSSQEQRIRALRGLCGHDLARATVVAREGERLSGLRAELDFVAEGLRAYGIEAGLGLPVQDGQDVRALFSPGLRGRALIVPRAHRHSPLARAWLARGGVWAPVGTLGALVLPTNGTGNGNGEGFTWASVADLSGDVALDLLLSAR